MGKTTALAKPGEYHILKVDPAARREIISSNLGALGVSTFDLDRANVPTGGATKFEVPTLKGTENVESLTGIIVGHKDCRVYWHTEYGEGEAGPPDCLSDDLITGIGNPGGQCRVCPMAQFKSARNGKAAGQACNQRRLLFLMRPDSMLPLVVSVPPGSLKNCKSYFLRLVARQLIFYGVQTKVTLSQATNSAGIKYAKADFAIDGDPLSEADREKYKAVVAEFAPYLKSVPVEPTPDYSGDGKE